MHKNILWFIVVVLCIYFSLILCEETSQAQELVTKDTKSDLLKSAAKTYLIEEGRTRKHRHHLFSMWGLHALAIAYLVKVKIVIVAFFVGSAVWLGLRYIWPQKCSHASYKEGPIILEQPPAFIHHESIPYSLDHEHDHYSDHHHFDSSPWSGSGPSSSFEPYSAYPGSSFTVSDDPPAVTSPESHTFRKKRDLGIQTDDEGDNEQVVKADSRQIPATEEQIGDFMFSFLGIDSVACRRRFICEMEFKSKVNPLTAMAFRVVGRSFFGKYTNDKNEFGRATSFQQCASVNFECVFIENEIADETLEEPIEDIEEAADVPTDDLKVELTTKENSLESNNTEEKENYQNIKAELRRNSYRRRVRGDRHLKTD